MMLTFKRLAILAFVVSLTACHYRVTVPGSDRVYYTTHFKRYKQSGTIKFKDKLTGQHVTLSSSEYEELSGKRIQSFNSKKREKANSHHRVVA